MSHVFARPWLALAFIGLTTLGAPVRADTDTEALARKALAVLKDNCYACHGRDGIAEGGMSFVLDFKRLVDEEMIVPGKPEESELFERMTTGMPPKKYKGKPVTQRPSEDDIATVKAWIEAGAPNVAGKAPRREFIAESDVLKAMLNDLVALNPERNRQFARYFTITHLYNAGLPDDELQTYRHALSKLINSLSRGGQIDRPVPIDAARTVFRVDLRRLQWDAATWKAILARYPYGRRFDNATARSVYDFTGSESPYVRADWFVFEASKPPLYHTILRIPRTDRELEDVLRVNVAGDIRDELVARAGFRKSGVSKHNRMIERHDMGIRGAYWKSYDFDRDDGRQNLFEFPLGSGSGPYAFQHKGGEIIFNLPNGLQAYMLVNATGERLDKGPIDIVREVDEGQKSIEVVNGISCMHCHSEGIKDKADEVRRFADLFPPDEADTIRALYKSKVEFDALLAKDKKRFADAVAETGGYITETEPVYALARRFERDLDLTLAAAEADLGQEEFKEQVRRSPRLFGPLKALLVGATVERDTFIAAFPDIVAAPSHAHDPPPSRGIHEETTVADDRNPPGQERDDNDLKMVFCWCPAGSFRMGSPPNEPERSRKGEDQVDVTLSRGFWMGKFEVTQDQWRRVMGTSFRDRAEARERRSEGPDHPIYDVSHTDAEVFCLKLTEAERAAGRLSAWWEYRLPTEAQWEYACRAGTTTATAFGDRLSSTDANFDGNRPYNGAPVGPDLRAMRPVGRYKPNAWGLHDMHGNVGEWCRDGGYASEKLPGGVDPSGPEDATHQVIRGGSWNLSGHYCRSASRDSFSPRHRSDTLGFRVARVSFGR